MSQKNTRIFRMCMEWGIYGNSINIDTVGNCRIVCCLLWKNHCLKREIYEFTRKLDKSLNTLLNGKKLDSAVYQQDDLWGWSI